MRTSTWQRRLTTLIVTLLCLSSLPIAGLAATPVPPTAELGAATLLDQRALLDLATPDDALSTGPALHLSWSTTARLVGEPIQLTIAALDGDGQPDRRSDTVQLDLSD